MICVGLPGDDDHEVLFNQSADAWEKWLLESQGVRRENLIRLSAKPALNDPHPQTLSGLALRTELADLAKKIKPDDSLWVFTLGHGHYDGQRSWFHVAGRDPSSDDLGRWLSDVKCREQVIWLTHSSSGWFVKPLSRPGRIVIAATAADDESNETEFPHALATVASHRLEKLDVDKDQKVSVAELFDAVVQEVQQRFNSDQRLPTEHAQLDDNGDGKGAEKIDLQLPASKVDISQSQPIKSDGDLARKTFVPWKSKPTQADPAPKMAE